MPMNETLRDEIVSAVKDSKKPLTQAMWDKWYKEHPDDFIDTVCNELPKFKGLNSEHADSIMGYFFRNFREKQIENVFSIKDIDETKLLTAMLKTTNALKLLLPTNSYRKSKSEKQLAFAELIVQRAIDRKATNHLKLEETDYATIAPNESYKEVSSLVVAVNYAPTIAELLLQDEHTNINAETLKAAMRSAIALGQNNLIKLIQSKAQQQNLQPDELYDSKALEHAAEASLETLETLLTGKPQPDLSSGEFLLYVLKPYDYINKKEKHENERDARVRLILNSPLKDVGLNKSLNTSRYSWDGKHTPLEYAIHKSLPESHLILEANGLDLQKSTHALECASESDDTKIFDALLEKDGQVIGINERVIKILSFENKDKHTVLEKLILDANQEKKSTIQIRKYEYALKIINHKDFDASKNQYAIFYALESGNDDLIKAIVTHKTFTPDCLTVKSNASRSHSKTLLHYGVSESPEGLIKLFKHSPHPIDISKDDSLLRRIINDKKNNLLEALLDHAKKHEIKDIGQNQTTPLCYEIAEEVSPLGYAIYKAGQPRNGNEQEWKTVELLLESGLTFDVNKAQPFFCAAAGGYMTPSQFAVLHSKFKDADVYQFGTTRTELNATTLALASGNLALFQEHLSKNLDLSKFTTHRGLLWYAALGELTIQLNTQEIKVGKLVDAVLEVADINTLNTKNDRAQSELGEVIFKIFAHYDGIFYQRTRERRINLIEHLINIDGVDFEATLQETDKHGNTLFARLFNNNIPANTLWLMNKLKETNKELLIKLLSATDILGRAVVVHKSRNPNVTLNINTTRYPELNSDKQKINDLITELGLADLVSNAVREKPETKTQPIITAMMTTEKFENVTTKPKPDKKSPDKKQSKKTLNPKIKKPLKPVKSADSEITPTINTPINNSKLEETWDNETKDARWYGKAALISLCFSPFGIPLIISAVFALIYAWKKAHQTVEMKSMSVDTFEKSSYAKINSATSETTDDKTNDETKEKTPTAKAQLVVFNKARCEDKDSAIMKKVGAVFSKLTSGATAIKEQVRVYTRLKV